jgi:hypothetical protein
MGWVKVEIDIIVKMIESVPRKKWKNEKTIRKGLLFAAKVFGKSFDSEDRLNFYVKEVKKVAKGGTSEDLFSKIMKYGYTREQIDDVRKRLNLIR